jgi:uncharacterized membrane protein YesL
MKHMTAMEGRFSTVMSRVWDIIVMNLLLLVCCLPVVTAGAAVTAVCDMSLRLMRQEEGYIIKGFFRAFRRNFKQATKLWLICLGVFAVCVGDLLAGRYLAAYGIQPLLTAAAGIQFILLTAVMQYLFPLTARFENTVGGTVKNAILLMVCHLPETLLMGLVSLSAPLILCFVILPEKIFPCFITLLIILWFAGGIYLNCKVIRRIFQKQFQSEETVIEEEPEEELDGETLELLYALEGAKGGK